MLTCCARRAYYSPNAIKGIVPRHPFAVNPPREIFCAAYRIHTYITKAARSHWSDKVFDKPTLYPNNKRSILLLLLKLWYN